MNDSKAIESWQSIVGPENVITLGPVLEAAHQATFHTTQGIRAIIRPGDSQEVQRCMFVANEFKVSVYPVSRGKNWGYGSRVPVRDRCVLMDLSRMNRILDYDEEMAYVTVEPGVTQQQLYDYLTEKGSKLFFSLTGSLTSTSLIGNTLERGAGNGPYGNRFDHVCGMEVILPTGERIHSGLERFANAKAARLFRLGVGLASDGLFSQSNLGIVTKMTFWLLPVPSDFQSFFFNLDDASRLPALIDALRSIKLGEPLRIQLALANDYRMMSFAELYPYEEAGGKVPLPAKIKERIKKKRNIHAWHGTGAIYSASPALGRAGRALIKKVLKPNVDRMRWVNGFKARLYRLLSRPYERVTGFNLKKFVDFAYDQTPFLGVPITESGGVPMAYWRKRTPRPPDNDMDPDRDRCGIIWCYHTIPFRGREFCEAVQIIEDVMLSRGFEPSIGLHCGRERTADITTAIVFDRDTPGEDEKAMACYHALLNRMIEAGYYPSRLGIQAMDALPQPVDDYLIFHKRLKQALDPNNVLAPGRYEFGVRAQTTAAE